MLGHKGLNVLNNSGSKRKPKRLTLQLYELFTSFFYMFFVGGLGSYTPKLANNDYQLGSFDPSPSKKHEAIVKKENNELIEDYLKPDSETTTWSNEIGADILF